MSCIKFPSTKNDLLKPSKESSSDYTQANLQLISIANQVFGEGNWSHAITTQNLDFTDYITGKYQAGCVSIVRVQLKDGTFHEDVGYSNTEGSTKGSAVQRARLGSYNIALKKALCCFGGEIAIKVNKPVSRSTSPVPPEIFTNKVNKVESNSTPIPIIFTNKVNKVDSNNTSTPVDKIASELFEDTIPISQTDALMDIVDLDQFTKDQNSNTVNNGNKVVKENGSKSSKSSGSSSVAQQKSQTNNLKLEAQIDTPKSPKPSTTAVEIQEKVNGVHHDVEKDSSKSEKSSVSKEELRLERKRKQREMQEEFKRQQEIKKKHDGTESKQQPNPRY